MRFIPREDERGSVPGEELFHIGGPLHGQVLSTQEHSRSDNRNDGYYSLWFESKRQVFSKLLLIRMHIDAPIRLAQSWLFEHVLRTEWVPITHKPPEPKKNILAMINKWHVDNLTFDHLSSGPGLNKWDMYLTEHLPFVAITRRPNEFMVEEQHTVASFTREDESKAVSDFLGKAGIDPKVLLMGHDFLGYS